MGYQFATSVYINEPTFAKEFASIFCGFGLFLWFPNFIFINLICFKSPVQEMPRVLADRSFGSLCPRVESSRAFDWQELCPGHSKRASRLSNLSPGNEKALGFQVQLQFSSLEQQKSFKKNSPLLTSVFSLKSAFPFTTAGSRQSSKARGRLPTGLA